MSCNCDTTNCDAGECACKKAGYCCDASCGCVDCENERSIVIPLSPTAEGKLTKEEEARKKKEDLKKLVSELSPVSLMNKFKEIRHATKERRALREELEKPPQQVWDEYNHPGSKSLAAFEDYKSWCLKDHRVPSSKSSITAYYEKSRKGFLEHSLYRYNPATDGIGSGSFGAVYKAETKDHTYYALKFPGAENADSDDLKKEIAIIRDLYHPNIVRFYGFVINDQQQVGIVMEYMKGGSLYHRLHEATPPLVWTVKQKRDGVLQLLQALTYLHGRDIVHRDLKSANVLLKSDSVDLYLCDFGLTLKNGRDSEGNYKPERAGTPLYMAPELFRSGIPPADLNGWKCADIFALCTVIGEIVTGKKPHAHWTGPRTIREAVLNSVQPFSHEDLGRILTDVGTDQVVTGWNGDPESRANLEVLYTFLNKPVCWLVDPP